MYVYIYIHIYIYIYIYICTIVLYWGPKKGPYFENYPEPGTIKMAPLLPPAARRPGQGVDHRKGTILVGAKKPNSPCKLEASLIIISTFYNPSVCECASTYIYIYINIYVCACVYNMYV